MEEDTTVHHKLSKVAVRGRLVRGGGAPPEGFSHRMRTCLLQQLVSFGKTLTPNSPSTGGPFFWPVPRKLVVRVAGFGRLVRGGVSGNAEI